MIQEFIDSYGTELIYALATAIFGYIGTLCKRVYERYVNTKTKKEVAETVVKAVEQLYKDASGEEKLNQAIISLTEMLADNDITVTDLECRMLIEGAVGSFNDCFNKTSGTVSETSEAVEIAETNEVTEDADD